MASTSVSTTEVGETSHRCEYCQKEFDYQSTLNVHRKVHLIKDFNCSCKYTTDIKTPLWYHTRAQRWELSYKCRWPNCTAAFGGKAELFQHEKVHKKGENIEFKLQCPQCDYNTVCQRSLLSHLRVHSEVKPFSCDLCPYRAKSNAMVQRHSKSLHSTLKPFKCQHPNCNSAFKRKFTLDQHQFVHNKHDKTLFKFQCSECNYKTNKLGSLKSHLMLHSDVKAFSCDLCPFRSRHKSNLRQHHTIVHSALRQFRCSVPNCSYSAKRLQDLVSHQKLHENN